MQELAPVITSPSAFFSSLDDDRLSWFHALLGYYLISFGAGSASIVLNGGDLLAALLIACIRALAGGAMAVFFYGVVWFFLGQKLVGGTARLTKVIGTVGLALFWPGVASLAIIPLGLMLRSQSNLAYVVVAPIQLLLGVWSLVLCGIAIRQVADLTVGKAVFVVLWFLGLVFLLGVVAAIVVPMVAA